MHTVWTVKQRIKDRLIGSLLVVFDLSVLKTITCVRHFFNPLQQQHLLLLISLLLPVPPILTL